MRRTFSYKLKPTKTQIHWMFDVMEHLRELQNSARDNRIHGWHEEGRHVSYVEQARILTKARDKHADFKAVPQDFQACALMRVERAFQNFFRRVNEGAEQPGFPRYRMRNRSFTWKLRRDKKGNRQQPIVKTDGRYMRLKVPKLGLVKVRLSRPLQGDPKEVTVVKKASGWHVRISCELDDVPKVEPTTAIGVDVGTSRYLTTSDGEVVENPRWYREAEGLLKKHQQRQSRRKRGSRRWQKAVQLVARHHERTVDLRKDFIGKLVYKLYHHLQNAVLVAERLGVKNMVKHKSLSKSIHDASWATFFVWCENIAERDGFHFHQVDPRNTSQICSCCGQKAPKKLTLSVRTFECVYCGESLDRDHNAARNILYRAALVLRGQRWVTTLEEARSRELQKKWKLQTPRQTFLFDAMVNNPTPSGLGH